MSFIAVIPARKNSVRVKNKNRYIVNKKPLIAYTISSALKSNFLKEVIVSTDCEKIKKISITQGAKVPFLRPKNISTSKTSSYSVIKHAWNFITKKYKNNFEYLVLLQPTSPLRTTKHINQACKMILKHKNADCLISTYKLSELFNNDLLMLENKKELVFIDENKKSILNDYNKSKVLKNYKFMQTANNLLQNFYIRNGPAILIIKTKNIKNFFIDGKIINYNMSLKESLDINTNNDINLFKAMVEKNKNI